MNEAVKYGIIDEVLKKENNVLKLQNLIFILRKNNQSKKLIAGPNIYICNEYVDLTNIL